MKIAFKSAVQVLLLIAAATVLNAQSAPGSIWGPAQYLSRSEFRRMVDAGTLKEITPGLIFRQDLEIYLRDQENRRVVEEYLRRNPELTQLSALVEARPPRETVRTSGGDYVIHSPGADGSSFTVITMSDATKLEYIANSIRASEDRDQQLALYQSFYDGYLAFYGRVCTGSSLPGAVEPPSGCSNLPEPAQLATPASLADSLLPAVQRALATIGSNAPAIYGLAPVQSFVLSCALQTPGSSIVANEVTVGDMTYSNGCHTPAANGVVANFNWVNRNLVSTVKSQGARGVCHIFGATSAMEEIVARDTGCIVNLAEQDFLEHVKLTWSPSLFGESGDPGVDLNLAASNNYHFAWEDQWDYNPSYYRINPPESGPPNPFAFDDSCTGYPYPGLEPGCSNTAPQAPIFCTGVDSETVCAYGLAVLTGPNSPFMATTTGSMWNPQNTSLSLDYMLLTLAFNNALVIGFGVTDAFFNQTDGYVTYDPSSKFDGGHAVHVVGYVANSDLAANPATASAPPGAGGGYFIIKNSWGTCAGDVGYYYAPVAYLEAEIGAAYSLSAETH
jgi:hypothetical protein